MEQVQRSEIVSAVTRSVQEVFATMLGLRIEPGEPWEEPAVPSGFNGVVALVGVAGAWTGSGRISCSSGFACHVASALLNTPYDAVSEDVLDAVAEVANMVMGNVKTIFEERLGQLGLSIPTVVFGRNYQTRYSGIAEWTVIPFTCDEHSMEVRFCLVSTPWVLRIPRPEAMLA